MKSAERTHYGLAVSCARRFEGRGVEMEELISEAEAALLFAASRFDESRGVRFSTYAIPVVLGALRQLCRSDLPMHVPRGDLRILLSAAAAQERMTRRDGREPDVCALSKELQIDQSRLSDMLMAQERMRRASSDAPGQAGEESFEEGVLLRDALSRLPSPYKQVLWLRFGLGVTQSDVARKFGVGQPQISRWEKRGLEQLRETLK